MKLQRRHLRLPRCGMGYGSPSRAALREASGISTPANEDGRVLSLQYRVTLSYSTVMQQSRTPGRGPEGSAAPTAQMMGVSLWDLFPLSWGRDRERGPNLLISFRRRLNFNKQVTFPQTFADRRSEPHRGTAARALLPFNSLDQEASSRTYVVFLCGL